MLGSWPSYDHHQILMFTAPLNGAVQTVVPNSHRPCLLYHSHFTRLAGHAGKHCTYDTMRCGLYWSYMANHVYRIVRDCLACSRNCASQERMTYNLLPTNGSLESIAMDILALLPKTTARNQFIIVSNDRHTKLTRTFPSWKTTARHVGSFSFDHWIVSYVVPAFTLTNNDTQFVSKLFKTSCTFVG